MRLREIGEWIGFVSKKEEFHNPYKKKSNRALPEKTEKEVQENLDNATRIYQALLPEEEENKPGYWITLWKKYFSKKVDKQIDGELLIANIVYKKTLTDFEEKRNVQKD